MSDEHPLKKTLHICKSTDGETRSLICYSKNVKKTPEEKTFKVKDLHLYLTIQSGTVFSPCLCKSTSWFLRKRKVNTKWVISNKQCVKKD